MDKRVRKHIEQALSLPPRRRRGPPPGTGKKIPGTRILTARVPEPLYERVELFARMEHRTRSNMVVVMLERYMRCPNCQRQLRPAIPKGVKP